jgi:toxin ParE1/3/4
MKINWRWSAVEDIENARHYIGQFNPTAATRVLDTIRANVLRLAGSPESGHPGRVEGTREFVVPHTPYLIAYTVIADQLIILAILHHAQNWPDAF